MEKHRVFHRSRRRGYWEAVRGNGREVGDNAWIRRAYEGTTLITSPLFVDMLNRAFISMDILDQTSLDDIDSHYGAMSSEHQIAARGRHIRVDAGYVYRRAVSGALISMVDSPHSAGLITHFCLPIRNGSEYWKAATALVLGKGGHRRAIDVTGVGSYARPDWHMHRVFKYRYTVSEDAEPLPEYVDQLRKEITFMCDLYEEGRPVADDTLYAFIRSKVEALSAPEVHDRYGECVDGYSPLDHLGFLVCMYVKSRLNVAFPLAVRLDFVQRDFEWVTDVLDKFSQPID